MNSQTAVLDRALIGLTGSESRNFLQGLITNDVRNLAPDRPLYAALLTPQGKILFDFFVYEHETALLLDCAAESAQALEKRLALYKLRAKIEIAPRSDLAVTAYWRAGSPPPAAFPDPRLSELGWRSVVDADKRADAMQSAYTEHRLCLGVPEAADFGQDAVFALDAGLEELHGVSFEKGCYVGQELTARMKHRGTARKRLLPIATEASALPSAPASISADGKEIGVITSTYGDRGFALVRLDRLAESREPQFEAAGIRIVVSRPSWLAA